ncbi:hypothetical protein LCGC14_0475030, partial [marine sediment metagenome]
LRGQHPGLSAGVGVTTTDHALLANLAFASAGHTGFQAEDAGLTSLAGLGYVSDSMIKITAEDTYVIRTLAEVRTDLGLVIGTNVLAYDVGLANLAGIAMAADKFYYTSADNVHVAATVTSFARSILDDANEAAFKATVNLEIGTDVLAQQTIGIADNNLLEVDHVSPADNDYAKFTVNGLEGRSYAEVLSDIGASASGHNHDATYQPLDAELTSLAALSYVAASFVKMTGANTFALRTIGETADDLEGTINHDNLANGGAHDYAYISGNDGATGVTAAELEELSDGSETTLHSHAGGGGDVSKQFLEVMG